MDISDGDSGVPKAEEMGNSAGGRLFVAIVFYIITWSLCSCEICLSFYDYKPGFGLPVSWQLQQRTEKVISVFRDERKSFYEKCMD